MKLLKENKGSTLLTTMFFILVVALLTISLHLALISMIDKVTADYDEKQAYVSARGIVTTIAQGISTASEDEQTEFKNDEELTVNEVGISDPLLSFLDGITDDVARDLTNISIGGVEIGQDNITGTIQRVAVDAEAGTATYLLSITTTYGDESETVSLSITRETVQVSVDEETETLVTIVGGYLSGFYLDFMPYVSSITYAEDKYEEDDAIVVCSSPLIYIDEDIYFGMKSHFYCEGTVVLVGSQKKIDGSDFAGEMGDYIDFYSKEDIHLKGLTSVKYVDLMAVGDIYLYEDTKISYATITCDTLYIDDGATISNNVTVYANEIEYIGSATKTSNMDVSISSSSTYLYLGNTYNSLTTYGQEIASNFGTKRYSQTISLTMAFPGRNVPSYVSAAEQLEATLVSSNTQQFKSGEEGADGEITYAIYELDNSKDAYTFSNSNFIEGYSDVTPIVVVVPDGVTVTISDEIDGVGVYFYLQESAQILVGGNDDGNNTLRIYSDPLDEATQAFYEAALLNCFTSSIQSTLQGDATTTTTTGSGKNQVTTTVYVYDNIQTEVFAILKEIYDEYAGIQTENAGEINGTITANVIKTKDELETDSKKGLEIEYNQSDDLGEQNITREEWETYVVDYNSFSVGVYIE